MRRNNKPIRTREKQLEKPPLRSNGSTTSTRQIAVSEENYRLLMNYKRIIEIEDTNSLITDILSDIPNRSIEGEDEDTQYERTNKRSNSFGLWFRRKENRLNMVYVDIDFVGFYHRKLNCIVEFEIIMC